MRCPAQCCFFFVCIPYPFLEVCFLFDSLSSFVDVFFLPSFQTPAGRPLLIKEGSGESSFGEKGGPGRALLEKIEAPK